MTATAPRAAGADDVIWHDVECGGYDADRDLWAGLAAERGGAVLELGCGSGRVALHLAARGHDVVAVDREQELVAALAARAKARGLAVETVCADLCDLRLERRFELAIAPMQLLQLLGGPEGRRKGFDAIARHLAPGGALAAAIVEGEPTAALGDAPETLPDVREHDGWIYSSLPLEVMSYEGRLTVRRLRQTVSPAGSLSEVLDTIRLDILDADQLEEEARQAGLMPAGRLVIEATDAHIGSTVVVLEREVS